MNKEKFQKTIWSYYKHRRDFPWRRTRNPYRILVSEVMLQQTQTHRVVKKYTEFIRKFPTLQSLARAPLKDVLLVWQGLGYNRRALSLRRLAEIVAKKYHGVLPRSESELTELPGIGHATASALRAFAFDERVVFIETNIRSVFIHFFLEKPKQIKNADSYSQILKNLRIRKNGVSDQELLRLVEKTLPSSNFREWYWALMDYGSMLKKTGSNPSRLSAHYTKQSTFKGSDRELRGKIIKALLKKSRTMEELLGEMANQERMENIVRDLIRDGLIRQKGIKIMLA